MNRQRPPAVAAGIDLNTPESNPGRPAPAGWVLVANFHTHPVSKTSFHCQLVVRFLIVFSFRWETLMGLCNRNILTNLILTFFVQWKPCDSILSGQLKRVV